MNEVYEFLKKCKTYYLATVEGDRPKVRPFGTIDIFDGALYIQTGKVKPTSKQIHANPNIELCAFDGTTWLRLSATATADPRIEAEEHLLAAYPELAGMYKPGDGNNEVLRLTDCTATFCSFGTAPKIFTF